MKKLNLMDEEERKDVLIQVAEELEEVIGFKPPIRTKGKSETQLKKLIKDAGTDVEPDDKLSDEAVFVLTELKAYGKGNVLAKGVSEKEEKAEEPKAEEPEDKEEKEEEEKEEEEKPKPPTKKKGGVPMTAFVDELIAKGGTFNALCKKAQAEGDKRGLKQQWTKSSFEGHIKFREGQSPGWLKKLKMQVTDKGIEVK